MNDKIKNMNEDKIKYMLKDIIDNGAEYEVKKCNRECNVVDGLYCDCEYKRWVPYKLGDEIRSDLKFRKVDKWFVVKFKGKCDDKFEIYCNNKPHDRYCTTVFESNTEEKCKKWIEKHTKTWLEETFPYPKNGDVEKWCVANSSRNGASKICEKILEDVNRYKIDYEYDCGIIELIEISDIHKIIKNLGVDM